MSGFNRTPRELLSVLSKRIRSFVMNPFSQLAQIRCFLGILISLKMVMDSHFRQENSYAINPPALRVDLAQNHSRLGLFFNFNRVYPAIFTLCVQGGWGYN